MEGKWFTLEEANALLPQLKEDLRQLQLLAEQIEHHNLKLQKIKVNHEQRSIAHAGQDPFFELESKLDFMQMEANLLINNFARKGVLLKMINPGLIDFPSVLEGEDILICWKEGEERITHYHGWHDGFMGRKQLPDDSR
ncbi:DUF2203 domain-containing protein [Cohnella luojiensis]|uniref:DUF2203 family protein n=1 Tax=Cohnella luojiensis TaxID=652876 RepID=A0A4Y8LWQ3_9BACL|nr:DUF2203 family protein [Cohnella luojiensis]